MQRNGGSKGVMRRLHSGAKRIAAWGVTALAASAMALSTPVAALAAGTQDGPSLTKTATDLVDDHTRVTLGIGASQEKSVSDVVFVLDKSVSTDVREEAISMLEELMTRAGENRIKVGVVVFNKAVYTNLQLTELNDENYETIKNALLSATSSGTNVQAGLDAGKALLDSDGSVAASAKHLVLVTDGVTYLWGSGTSQDGSDIYSIYSENTSNGEENLYASHETIGWHHADTTSYFAEFNNVNAWYNAHGSNIKSTIDTYANVYGEGQYKASAYGITSGQGTATDWSAIDKFENENSYVPQELESATASASDAAVYSAVTSWKNIVNAGYHAYAYAEQDYASSYPWAPAWVASLNTVGGTSGAVPADTTGMFDAVKSSILYEIQSGVVTDVIGSNFDLTDAGNIGADTFELTVDDQKLTGTVDAANPNKVNFYDAEGTVLYSVEYQKAGDTETLVWTIATPVESGAGVTLSYDLTLVNKETAAGHYEVPTNESAELDYKTTEGEEKSAEFPKPVVSYDVAEEPQQPADPGTDAPVNPGVDDTDTTDDAAKPVKKPAGDLPQTGDVMGVVTAALALAGAGAVGVGGFLKRRK